MEFGVRRKVLLGFKLLFGARYGNFGVVAGKLCPYQVVKGKGKLRSSSTKYLGARDRPAFHGVFPIMLFLGHSDLSRSHGLRSWTLELGRLASNLHICFFSLACMFLLFVAFHGVFLTTARFGIV